MDLLVKHVSFKVNVKDNSSLTHYNVQATQYLIGLNLFYSFTILYTSPDLLEDKNFSTPFAIKV